MVSTKRKISRHRRGRQMKRSIPRRRKYISDTSSESSQSSYSTETSDETYYPSDEDVDSDETDDEDTDDEATDDDMLAEPDQRETAKQLAPFLMLIGDGGINGGKSGNVRKKTKEDKEYEEKNPEYKAYYEKEKNYYKTLTCEERLKIDAIEKRMKELNEKTGQVPRRFTILTSEMDEKTKAAVICKLDQLDRMSTNDNEYHKLSAWMDAVLKMPIGRYKKLPVNYESTREEIKTLLKTTKHNLDHNVYGHHEVKDHIIRVLAQWVSNPSGKGIVIGIQGGAGVGKTTLIKKGICNSLDLPFVFLPLGGMADRTELVGSSYVYEGSRWGRITDSLMKCGYMNPVFFFDELDKVSDTKHGDDIINILMQITDSSQNDKFHDVYFSDFEFDLSRSIIIFAYNDENAINPILRDRMIKIETKGYKISDKLCIAHNHLVPDMLEDFRMPKSRIKFDDTILRTLIEYVDEEQGVRNLKRAIHDIISNLHLNMLIGDIPDEDTIVTRDHIYKFVHKRKTDQNTSHLMIYT